MPHERSARQVLLATPKLKWPRRRPRTRWRDYTPDLAYSPFGMDSAEISRIAENCDPTTFLRGISGMKINKWMIPKILRSTLLHLFFS